MAECYECGNTVDQLSKRSRCVDCECGRSLFNERENERLRQMLDGLADLSNARLVAITDENYCEIANAWRHVGKECVVVTAYSETAVVEAAIGNDPLYEWLRERAKRASAALAPQEGK